MTEPAQVAPQGLDAEESVLGCILLPGTSLAAIEAVVAAGLAAGDFYRASHGAIFHAALTLHGRGAPVDAITLADELERSGAIENIEGGKRRIHELAALVPAAANAGHYARIVRGKALQRKLVAELRPVVEAAQNGGISEPVEAVLALERAKGLIDLGARSELEAMVVVGR